MLRYREGLMALAMLTVSGVIAVAIAVDPKGFSIRDWQTLLAAFVALGAASLAYRAAMAKVDLDRETHHRERRRQDRKAALRTQFAVFVAKSEAETFSLATARPASGSPDKAFRASELTLRTHQDLDEAWGSLDSFPREISRMLAGLRIQLYNIDDVKRELGNDQITLVCWKSPEENVRHLNSYFETVARQGAELFDALERYIRTLEE